MDLYRCINYLNNLDKDIYYKGKLRKSSHFKKIVGNAIKCMATKDQTHYLVPGWNPLYSPWAVCEAFEKELNYMGFSITIKDGYQYTLFYLTIR